MTGLRKALLPALLSLGFAAGSAQAAILVEDWDLNLDAAALAAEGLTGTVSGIDQITYQGVAQTGTFDTNGDGVASAGDQGVVYGALSATAFVVNGSPVPGQVGTSVLGIDYEITFVFQVDAITTSFDGTVQETDHLAAGSPGTQTLGTLSIYIDNITDGSQSSTVTGTGFDDGTLIATFADDGTGSGVFSLLSGDGSDDATFSLISALAGVLTKGGQDLTTGTLLAITDSNFDADLNNDGVFDVPAPSNTAILGGDICGGACLPGTNFFAEEDGSARLAVPEPASLLLLGGGLLGMAWQRRRRADGELAMQL